MIAILIAAAVALVSRYSVSSHGLTEKRSETARSTTQVLVDTRYSSLARLSLSTTASTVTQRTPLYADYAASLPVSSRIAARAGLSADKVSITADTTETSAPSGGVESTSYNTAPDPNAAPNRVTLTATDVLPIITIVASSPSVAIATNLVNSTVAELQRSVSGLEKTEHVKGPNRMVLRPLGPASSGVVITTPSLTKTIIVGIGVLIVLLLSILFLDSLRRRPQRPARVSVAA